MDDAARAEGPYGIVVIGRNEGELLRRCLESVAGVATPAVYVDSGSTDGSVAMARRRGVEVVELDMRIPFTAARARNEGFARLRQLAPRLPYVQFVDGDCEVAEGWLEAAAEFLGSHPEVAAVCGRRKESHPERSVYNMLCDCEWDTPVGEAKACGGDAMMRSESFAAIGGFRAGLIAGEEPELCVRLRQHGWRIWRLDREMTLHDARMTRFAQWWRRVLRSGHAMAEGAYLHGRAPERHRVRESLSTWFWGAGIPALVCLCIAAVGPGGLLLLAVYPAQVARLAMRAHGSARQRWWRAAFLVLGKWPELIGQLTFVKRRFLRETARLIEYK